MHAEYPSEEVLCCYVTYACARMLIISVLKVLQIMLHLIQEVVAYGMESLHF